MKNRARQILLMKANGMLSKQIASELNIDRRTVEHHLNEARKDLDAKTTPQAVARAIKDGAILTSEILMLVIMIWAGCAFNVDVRRGSQSPTPSRTKIEVIA